MKKNGLVSFMDHIIHKFEKEDRHSSAHVYRSTKNSFLTFIDVKRIHDFQLSANLLKGFENYLIERQLSWNTVSTYMRMLRATYNRAVEQGVARYIPNLFKGVYTGVQSQTKRALPPPVMARLIHRDTLKAFPESEWFALMFLLRGIPFVDLAHLRKCDFGGGVITYHRHKTRKELNVSVPDEAMEIIRRKMDKTSSPYLFPILDGAASGKEAYKNYQSALRKLNHRLSEIAKKMELDVKLSSYVARHTWATTAYHQRLPIGIISGALGHSSIKVTESYLKPFDNNELGNANLRIISYIKGSVESTVTS